MFRTRLWLALPLLLAAAMAPARAAEIRDAAGLFSAEAIREAQAKLDQIGQQYKVPVVIETVESIGEQSIDQAAVREAQRSGTKGIFILIAKEETKIEVLVSRGFQAEFPREQRLAIRDAFVAEFKKRDFDAGLARGVEAIERAASTAQARAGAAQRPEQGRHQAAPPVVARRNPPANPKGGSSGLSILIVIGLVILAVLIGIRLLSGLFGAQRGGYYAGSARPGGPGYGGPAPGPGYGPGPGGPAYGPGYGGGRGGGFWSGLLGGLGGAVAGNWLYDQFRHQHPTDTSGGYYGGGPVETGGQPAAPEGPEWVGTGESADWGGGGDAGGGDWAGTDTAGGDWGGTDIAGGDWGGGGGDEGNWS